MKKNRKPGFGERPPDALGLVDAQIDVNRAIMGLLDRIAELDTDEARQRNSIADLASLLTFDLGFARKTAQSWVRIAAALGDLPLTAHAFRMGAISFDQLEVLVKLATTETEGDLLDMARFMTPTELAREAREAAKIAAEKDDVEKEPITRSVRMWWSDDSSHLNFKGEIPGADGVLVEAALMSLGTKNPKDPHSGLYRPADEQNADALIQMASESYAEDRTHDVSTVVVHVTAKNSGPGRRRGDDSGATVAWCRQPAAPSVRLADPASPRRAGWGHCGSGSDHPKDSPLAPPPGGGPRQGLSLRRLQLDPVD